jgi:hypothetical protein
MADACRRHPLPSHYTQAASSERPGARPQRR